MTTPNGIDDAYKQGDEYEDPTQPFVPSVEEEVLPAACERGNGGGERGKRSAQRARWTVEGDVPRASTSPSAMQERKVPTSCREEGQRSLKEREGEKDEKLTTGCTVADKT
jgi:hypothetical protein